MLVEEKYHLSFKGGSGERTSYSDTCSLLLSLTVAQPKKKLNNAEAFLR
jgi:hypothetical protein